MTAACVLVGGMTLAVPGATGFVSRVTVVGIPFGVASFRVGMYALWPFGRELVKKPGAGVASGLGNFFWFILSGFWLAIAHAITGVLLCITVIGIPLVVANFKLVPVALMPLGREIVAS